MNSYRMKSMMTCCLALALMLVLGWGAFAEDGVYLLEKQKGFHRVGNGNVTMPVEFSTSTMDFEITEDGSGLFILDDQGQLYSEGEVTSLKSQSLLGSSRKKVAISRKGYAVLDGEGNIEFGGGQPDLGWNAYFGWDIARDIELNREGDGMLVLDGMGGLYSTGTMPEWRAPFFGWDVARDVEITPDGDGCYVLDGYGFIHCLGNAEEFEGVNLGWDIARDMELSQTGRGYYILDGFGGLHVGGDAIPFDLPYFGWDVATDLELSPQPLGSLTGKVLGEDSSGSQQPVAGAVVILRVIDLPEDSVESDALAAESNDLNGYRNIKARTDSEGNYQFETLPAGNYSIKILASRYKRLDEEVEVVAGVETVRDFVLTAINSDPSDEDYGTVKGTVAEDAGELDVFIPIANAKVKLYISNRRVMNARTNDQGEFEFEKVPVGTFYVKVEAKDYEPEDGEVEVIAGEIAYISFELSQTPDPIGRIYGMVWTSTSELCLNDMEVSAGYCTVTSVRVPVPGAELHLIPTDHPFYQDPVEGSSILPTADNIGWYTVSDDDGEYEFNDLPLGKFILLVKAEGYAQARRVVVLAGNCQDNEACHEKKVDVRLVPLVQDFGSIFGNVSAASDTSGSILAPLPGAIVHAIPQNLAIDSGEVVALDAQGQCNNQITSASADCPNHFYTRTDENGDYKFDRLPAGDYLLVVTATGYEAERREVNLPAGAELEENFILYPVVHPEGRIEGMVWGATAAVTSATPVAGDPLAGAIVVLVPAVDSTDDTEPAIQTSAVNREMNGVPDWLEDMEISRRYRTVTTAPDGSYSFEEVPVGNYRLVAKARGYYPQSKQAEVFEDQTTTVNFILDPYQPPTVGSLVGYVTDSETADPIRRAVVTAWPVGIVPLDATPAASTLCESDCPNPQPYRTVTDDNGEYGFDRLPVGLYRVTVRARDYQPATAGAEVVENQVTLLNFALQPEPDTGAVVGFVRETNNAGTVGAPIPNALVTMIPWDLAAATDASTGRRSAESDPAGQIYRTHTNNLGWYEFPELPVGRYLMRVEKEGYITKLRRIKVLGGVTVQANFALKPEGTPPAGIVVGTVYALPEGDDEPEPIPGAYVYMFSWRANWVPGEEDFTSALFFSRTNQDGEYEFDEVPPRSYMILVYAPGYEIDFQKIVVKADEVTQANFFLEPESASSDGVIYGRVTKSSEAGGEIEPVKKAHVRLYRLPDDFVSIPEYAQNLDPEDVPFPVFMDTWTNGNGDYRFGSLPAGQYLILVIKESLGFQGAILYLDEGEKLEKNFHFIVSDPDTGGEVVGRCLEAAIDGTRSGQGIADVKLTLLTDGVIVTAATSDENGNYRFQDVAAGTYKLVAEKAGYSTPRIRVVVYDGGVTYKDVWMEPLTEMVLLFGKVATLVEAGTSSVREPVPGAKVILAPEVWPFSVPLPNTTTDEQGNYRLSVPAGSYLMKVEKEGFETYRKEIELVSGELEKNVLLEAVSADSALIYGRVSAIGTVGAVAIPGATIDATPLFPWLMFQSYPYAISDASGHYRLEITVPGSYILTVKKEGYAARYEFVTVELGDAIELPLLLSPASQEGSGVLVGEIRTSDGDSTVPVPNATVRLLPHTVRTFAPIVTQTDENGWFWFLQLPVDDYTMVVEKQGYQTLIKDLTIQADDILIVGEELVSSSTN